MDASQAKSAAGVRSTDPGVGSEGEIADLASILVGRAREIGGHVERLAQVRRDRLEHRLQTAIAYGAIGLFAGLATLTLGILGAVLLARGLAASLTVLVEGRAWLGELLAGVLLLGGLGTTAVVALRLHERRELRRKKAKYATHTGRRTAT